MIELARRLERVEERLWVGGRHGDDFLSRLSTEDLHNLYFALVVDRALNGGNLKRVPNLNAYRQGKQVLERLDTGGAEPLLDELPDKQEFEEAFRLVSRYVKATVWEELSPEVAFPLS